MKYFWKAVSPVICAMLLTSCQSEWLEAGSVSVEFRAVSKYTKSSVDVQENEIENINYYVYSQGVLYTSSYSEQSTATFQLDRAREYAVYALANVGEVLAPYKEDDLGSLSFDCSPDAGKVLPMCLREGKRIKVTGAEGVIDIPLTRLFAKYSLNIKPLLENCSVAFTSVRICQAASGLSPFSGSSKATGVCDGDYASEEDLALLNDGQTVEFYVPENCQGVLLPGNTDPWKKNLESGHRQAGLCTYMEIKGDWSTVGAQADLTLRLYLGNDSTTDFNVVRNTNVALTLSLSDDGTLKSNWKSTLESFTDERRLSFTSSSQKVYQEDGWTRLPVEVYPSDMTFYASVLSEDIEESLEIKTSGGSVYARCKYDGNLFPSAVVKVESWDGRQKSQTNLQLAYRPSEFTSYTAQIPQCVGEYGHIIIGTAADDVQVVTSNGSVWNLDDGSMDGWQEYYDSVSCDRLYLDPDSRTLYIFRESEGGESSVCVKSYKSQKVFELSKSYPINLCADDGFITESGCYNVTESSQYYDSMISLYPAYSDGSAVSMNRFRMPAALMAYKGVSGLQGAYETFEKRYGYSSFSANWGSKAYCSPGYNPLSERFQFYENTGKLNEVKVFGIDDLSEDEQYSLTFRLSGHSAETVSKITCRKAFPAQGFLGEVYNYQVAPGNLRNLVAAIPFVEGSDPSRYCTTWSVRHSLSDKDVSAQLAYESASDDIYSALASVKDNSFSFTQMSSTTFPSCGHLALKGTVTNPYSKKSYTGYYTVDLVLYLSIGCQFDYIYDSSNDKTQVGVAYVPFCEFAKRSWASVWNDNLPDFFLARSSYVSRTSVIKVPSASSENAWTVDHDGKPKAILQEAMADLSSHKDYFEFTFSQFFTEGNELVCNRSGFGKYPDGSGMEDYADGRKGYYHLVRQYDLNNIAAVVYKKGLDNYLIEAAYGSISIY